MSESKNCNQPDPTAKASTEPVESVEYRTADYQRGGFVSDFNFDFPSTPQDLGRLGPYRIIRELGRGGMGAVFFGFDERLGRSVALKVMLPKYSTETESKGRFLKEARAAAKLDNDHIVTIYEANAYNDTLCIAMQLLQGMSLDHYLKANPRLDLSNVLRIGKEIAIGLAAAHEAGIVHRDIKLANLWIESPSGRVKILDFGLAKRAWDESQLLDDALAAAPLDRTATGAVLGTPLYMSPEQARGESVDFRSDIYSLGVVLYRMSTGTMPFDGKSMRHLLYAINNYPARPVRDINSSLPASFSNLIDRMMRKSADQRPRSAIRVAQELQHIDQETSSPWEAIAPSDEYLNIAIGAYGAGKSFPVIEEELWESGVYRELIPIVLHKLVVNRAESHLREGRKPERVIELFIEKGLDRDVANYVVRQLNLADSKRMRYIRYFVLSIIAMELAIVFLAMFGLIAIGNNYLFLLVMSIFGSMTLYAAFFASRT